MDNSKSNDLVSLAMVNPDASLGDLMASGITASNTSVRPEQDYVKNPVVQNAQQFKDNQGQFSPAKFHKFYQSTINQYNALAQEAPKASKWDIFAKPSEKKWTPDYEIKQIYNPDRVTNSMVEVGKAGPRTKSRAEIAQTQQVWDPVTRTYSDAPNNNFWGTLFGDNEFLAQWDFDADAKGNPTSDPNKIVYHQGEYKLNDKGTYYYEKANGRNIEGKQTLHVSDILTDDDSFANKFDFIDSDGLTKSPFGSIAKNAALIGSMYIPYVGPVIAGLSVAQQGLKLFSTFGKMLTSSDNSAMDRLAGFADKTDFFHTQSEYANEHPWTWENMINMVGDTMGQLKQQRFLFEYAPAAFKGTTGINTENQAKKVAQITADLNKGNKAILDNSSLKLKNFEGIEDAVRNMQNKELMMNNQQIANKMVEDYMKQYYKIGEIISKTYMTGITVQDMYQEAKNAGASDQVAMGLTMGYAAAEAKLLNTGIGEWVLPELRAQRNIAKNIVKSMADGSIKALNSKAEQTASSEAKRGFIKEVFNIGKDIFSGSNNVIKNSENGVFKKTLMGNVANALGEGTEEVTEEVLADVVRGAHDLATWLSGSKQKDMLNMNGWQTRYAMNFLGGFVGGGTHSVFQNYNTFKTYSNLSSDDAVKEVISMVRNNNQDQLYDALDKLDFGNKNLSTQLVQDEEGTYGYGVGTDKDNQNDIIKNAVRQQIKLIETTLNESGANVSNESLLNEATLRQLKYSSLMQTKTAGKYLETFNNETAKLVKLKQQISDYKSSFSDKDKRESNDNNSDYEAGLQPLLDQYKEQQQKVKDLADGKNAASFMTTALLETNPEILKEFNDGVTFETFVQSQTGKTIDTITDSEKSDLMSRYQTYLKTDAADDVQIAATQYLTLSRKVFGGENSVIDKYNLDSDSAQQAQKVVKKIYDSIDTLRTANENVLEGNPILYGGIHVLNPRANESLSLLRGIVDDSLLDEYDTKINETAKYYQDKFSELNNRKTDEAYSDKNKQADINSLTLEANTTMDLMQNIFMAKIIPNLVNKEISRGWANRATKEYLNNLIEKVQERVRKLDSKVSDASNLQDPMSLEESAYKALGVKSWIEYNDDSFGNDELIIHDLNQKLPELKQILENLNESLENINKVGVSPVEQLLNKFILDVTGDPVTIDTLLGGEGGLESILAAFKTNLNGFTIQDELKLYQLRQAIKATQMMHALIQGMRTDNIGHTIATKFDTGNYIQNFDLFGVNATLNNIHKGSQNDESWKDLPTIEGEKANELLQDLRLISQRLNFFLTLHEQNKNSKLIMQPKIAVQSTLNLYRKVQKLVIGALPDDQWDKSMFATLPNLKTFSGLNLEPGENDQDNIDIPMEQLYADRIAMDNAIYEFYQVNIENGSHSIEELIDEKTWNLFNSKESELTSDKTNTVDDIDFYYYLSARAALKASDFYNAYKGYISDTIAPIFAQEMGVYLGVAHVVNGNTISAFNEALKNKMLSIIDSKDFEGRAQIIQKYLGTVDGVAKLLATESSKKYLKELIGPKFSNIIFIEGKAGTGKTAAVINMIASIINNDWISQSTWVVNNTHANADKLAKNLSIKTDKVFDGKELLEFISTYEYPERVNDVLQYEKGKHYDFDVNGNLVPKAQLKSVGNVPNVIFIDEVSRFTDNELNIINSFARKNGISVITAGDLNQISAKGKGILDIKDALDELRKVDTKAANWVAKQIKDTPNQFEVKMAIERQQLTHSFRLKNSLRTANVQSTTNGNTIEALIKNGKGPIQLNYFESFDKEYILSGTKIVNYSDLVGNFSPEEVTKTLDGLISTVKRQSNGTIAEEDKIGYIYQKEGTTLYNLINSPKYKDFFQKHQGGNSQGLESDYYVIELDPSENQDSQEFMKSLYTGITRARKGSLLLTSQIVGPYDNILNKSMDEATELEPMPAGDIKHQSELVKHALDTIEGEDLKLIERTKYEDDIKPQDDKPTKKDDGNTTQVTIDTFTKQVFVFEQQLKDFIDSEVNRKLEELIADTPDLDKEKTRQELYEKLLSYISDKRIENGLPDIDSIIHNILSEFSNTQDNKQKLLDLSSQDDDTKDDEKQDESTIDEVVTNELNGNQNKVEEVLDKANNSIIVPQSIKQNILYSFNSLSLGGYKINAGQLVPTNPKIKDRIDGVDGIIKLATLAGKDTNIYLNNPDKTIEIISKIQSIVRYATSKKELNNKLKILIFKEFGLSIDRLSCDFMFKSSVSSPLAEQHTQFQRFAKDPELETPLYNKVIDREHSRGFRKEIVASIAIDGNGYTFETSVMALNSPITKGLQSYEDKPYYPNVYAALTDTNIKSMFNRVVKIVAEKIALKDGDPNLHNLFQLYLLSQAAIYKLDDNWLPSTSLVNYGVQYAGDAGLLQLNGWWAPNLLISLRELSSQQNIRISKVLVSRNSSITINDENGVITVPVSPKEFGDTAGYPFVLITDNLELNEQRMYEQYIRQLQNPNDPKIVKQLFVLPPTVSFDDYIETLKAFNDSDVKGVRPQGNNYTIYNVWQALLKSDEQKIKAKIIEYFDQETWEKFKQAIDSIESTGRDYKKGTQILNTTENWGRGSFGKDTTVERNLIYMLRYICFPDAYDAKLAGSKFVESQDFQDFRSIFNRSQYKIRENIKIDTDHSLGDFNYAKINGYTIKGKDIEVGNKITTSAYLDTSSLKEFLNKVVEQTYTQFSKDPKKTIEDLAAEAYRTGGARWNYLGGPLVLRDYYTGAKKFTLSGSSQKVEIYKPSDEYSSLKEDFEDKLPAIDYNSIQSQEQLESLEANAFKQLCININSDVNMSQFAYIDSNGNFQITEENDLLLGHIQDNENGNIAINGVLYELNTYNNQISLDEIKENSETMVSTSFPNINLSDEDVLYITKGLGSPAEVIQFSSRLSKNVNRNVSERLLNIEQQISSTDDIETLRQLALNKIQEYINIYRENTQEALRENKANEIKSNDATLQEQLRNYFKNNTEEDIVQENRCDSIIINLL